MWSDASLAVPPLFAALAGARNVLIAGAGGDFDVYAGLPLANAARRGRRRAPGEPVVHPVGTGRPRRLARPGSHGRPTRHRRPGRVLPGTHSGPLARGDFGNLHVTTRTRGSELFVNPLMAIYFTVELGPLAARSLYLDRLENTVGMQQVRLRIEAFRNEISPRIPRAFPH